MCIIVSSYILRMKFMKFDQLLTLTAVTLIPPTVGQLSVMRIGQEITTKRHVHYSIVIYTQNEIHEIRSIANFNCGYIDPADSRPTVSDANRPIVGRQSAYFFCDFSCFLGSAGCKEHNCPVLFIFLTS